MSRLFTQPLNGTAHMHQVAVGIFACTRTDVIYTMGLFKPDSYAKTMGLFVRGSPIKISQRMVRTNVNFPQSVSKRACTWILTSDHQGYSREYNIYYLINRTKKRRNHKKELHL